MEHHNIMKLRFALFILLLSVLCTIIVYGSATASRSIKIIPVKGKIVSVILDGNEKTYYDVSKSSPVVIEVDGPGKITVMSRLSLSKTSAGSNRYSIVVKEGDKIVKIHSTATESSPATFKDRPDAAGKLRKFRLTIPEGTHTYAFYLDSTASADAAIKFSMKMTGSAKKLVTLEPLSYDKVVTAVSGEKLITYYVSSKAHPVQLLVVGPTRVKITTRLNYDNRMKGSQKYTVLVSEGEQQIKMKPLSTTKAIAITYQEWKDVVPGKNASFFVDVPEGEHTYRFSFSETLASSVSLKFSIPQKDLKNEE